MSDSVHVNSCVINENKHPFQDFHYLFTLTLLINPLDFNYFHHVRLFSFFLCVADVVACGAFDHDLIVIVDHLLSEGA